MRLDLLLRRFLSGADSTLGELFLGGQFVCFTCEDERRAVKVADETRIPEGCYKIELRDALSPMNKRYSERFDFHQGMLWLQDVPDFTYVYIHVGNDDDDTSGCVLVGKGAVAEGGEGRVLHSVDAYSEIYPVLADAIKSGVEVYLTIEDVSKGVSGV